MRRRAGGYAHAIQFKRLRRVLKRQRTIPGRLLRDIERRFLQLIHRGKHKTISTTQRKWLKRRQAIEPIIGHVKQDHGMQRCWLKGQTGDALYAVLCAAGYNLRWLLRAIVRLGLAPVFFVLAWLRCLLNVLPQISLALRTTI